jgi:hypothetical protein
VHGLSSFVTIVLVTILMIIAGIFYAVGVIGADICVDPNGTLLTLASSNGLSGGMAGDTLNYFLTCGVNPGQPPIGAAGMISGIVSTVQGAASQVASLRDQASDQTNQGTYTALAGVRLASPDYSSSSSAASPALTSLSTHMGYSADAVASLAGVMSCQTIDPILSTLWTGACTNGVATIIGIARILIVASVLLFIQLGIGIDMRVCRHVLALARRLGADPPPSPLSPSLLAQVLLPPGPDVALLGRGGRRPGGRRRRVRRTQGRRDDARRRALQRLSARALLSSRARARGRPLA